MNRLESIRDYLLRGELDSIVDETKAALAEGLEPRTILDEALIKAMDEVGRRFQTFEYFLPEVLVSAKAMKAAMTLLKPYLAQGDSASRGVILLGTVAGDRHDIGKNLVAMMLQGAGYEVHDLGIDIAPEAFVEAAQRLQPRVVGLSSMLTTTMPAMGRTIQALNDAGLKGRLSVVVGGASVTEAYGRQIGAQGYAPDASLAVELVRSLMEARQG